MLFLDNGIGGYFNLFPVSGLQSELNRDPEMCETKDLLSQHNSLESIYELQLKI